MKQVVAISGGVGGAKLALGLSRTLAPEALAIVANTADDFEHLGLYICPDLDTVMYTLAGINDQERGWGLAGETWQALERLRNYGAEDWFSLGDRDLATHILRTDKLRRGKTLTEITAELGTALGVANRLLPMTDDPVRTQVETDAGRLPFQHYFVRERCAPKVQAFHFDGIEAAKPQPDFLALLQSGATDAVVICPSNPFVSVGPVLALPGVKLALQDCSAPVIVVTPLVAGRAIKGPTAKMMQELEMPLNAAAIASLYRDIADGFVLDTTDERETGAIRDLGLQVHSCNTLMHSLDDRLALARNVLEFAKRLSQSKP